MLKLHLDTDIGGDMDDLCALALVLNWPGAEPLAVTTVAEHQGKRAGYARYALRLAGREAGVAVAAGADASGGYYRSWPDLPFEKDYWPEAVPPAPTSLEVALDLLEQSIRQDAIIVAVGALTNLSLLEQRSPGILRDARLYLMGGYVYAPRQGFPQLKNEDDYNIQVDVASARRVFESSSPTLVPLSVTVETSLRRAHLTALRRASALARLIAAQAQAYARDEEYETKYGRTCAGLPDDILNFQHDPLTCAVALGWREGVEISEIPLTFEMQDGWLRQKIDAARGKLTKVVTRVEGDKFNEFWLKTVTRETAAG